MKRYKIISTVLYLLPTLIILSLGLRFFTATEYFSYHEQAADVAFATVAPGLQFVFLAVFKVCGAALTALSVCLLVMIIFPFAKHRHRWSYYAIPSVAGLFWATTLGVTLYVTMTTSATAPWTGSLSCVVMILAAFVSSLLDLSKGNSSV